VRKIVDATKGNLSVTNAVLELVRLELVTRSPIAGKVVPFWKVNLTLSADAETTLAVIEKEFAFNANVNPVTTIRNNIQGADLAGWTVTRFVNEP
jgi:hypothetical protein